MIQHEHRQINSSTMVPTTDAVCPHCRHAFPLTTPTATSSSQSAKSNSTFCEERPFTSEYCNKSALHCHEPTTTTSSDQLPTSTTESPPTPPPRFKPATYANMPSSATSSSSTASNSKSYVTMSNINLQTTGATLFQAPNFIPLSSPTSTPPVFPTCSTSFNKSNTVLPTVNNRMYRQLSGGGLIESTSDEFRIHEPQPMHQMCGGGLVNANPLEDSPFLNASLPSNYSKPTKLLISSRESPGTSISITPANASSSNISILVPTSVNTSLQISSNAINITLPRSSSINSRSSTSFHHNLPFSATPALRRSASQRQTRRAREAAATNSTPSSVFMPEIQPVFYPTFLSNDMLMHLAKSASPPVDDMTCLTKTVACLKESGWFHEGLSWNESETLLTGSTNGTFVVRESSNPSFLFAITVQTEQEPTSVRIQYDNGRFRLDCVSHVTPIVPQFNCVVDLIEYYVTKHNPDQSHHSNNKLLNSNNVQFTTTKFNNFLGNQVFVDENGHINSVVSLKRPLRNSVPSLMHCARLSINKQLKCNKNYAKNQLSQILNHIDLPKSLKTYLFEYPYTL